MSTAARHACICPHPSPKRTKLINPFTWVHNHKLPQQRGLPLGAVVVHAQLPRVAAPPHVQVAHGGDGGRMLIASLLNGKTGGRLEQLREIREGTQGCSPSVCALVMFSLWAQPTRSLGGCCSHWGADDANGYCTWPSHSRKSTPGRPPHPGSSWLA